VRLAHDAHEARPWRIHDIVPDFRLEDVWELPVEGGPGELPRLVALIASFDPVQMSSMPARTLFAIRRRLGELLGLDRVTEGTGTRVPTLRDRLPADLRHPGGTSAPAVAALPLQPLYLTDDEWAAESANRTMHGVLHLGWVPCGNGSGRFRAHLAVLVKPNGALGHLYMAAIKPFRHLIVYPALLREIGRSW
jgi:hypothetical protein